MEYLAKHFAVVHLDEIVSQCLGTGGKGRGMVALTFDDGLRSNFTVVYPILKRLRLPATFYVCPGVIGQSLTIWTYEARARLKRLSPQDRASLSGRKEVREHEQIDHILAWMKAMPLAGRQDVEQRIRHLTPGFQFDEEEVERFGLMSWEEIKALDPRIITIGSHTCTHADLTQVDSVTLEKELGTSQRELEYRLDRPVAHLAYPNGSYDGVVIGAARKFYRSAVTVRGGGTIPGDDVFALRRIIIAESELSRFAWKLAVHGGSEHPG